MAGADAVAGTGGGGGPSASVWYDDEDTPDTSRDDEPVFSASALRGEWAGGIDAAAGSQSFVRSLPAAARPAVETMSRHVWTHYENNKQDAPMHEWKRNLLAHLQVTVEYAFDDFATARLYATGSTVNGCGAYNSDMDACLLLTDDDGEVNADRRFAVEALYHFQRAIEVCDTGSRLVHKAQFINAKVPILRLLLRRPYDVIEVDININNIEGIYNSHLCQHYARLDPRFPALALVIKHWAIRADINNPFDGTLNSYSLILMLLHYLQYGAAPWVLPNLFVVAPECFERRLDVDQLHLVNILPGQIERLHDNKQSVGELLAGFFAYYNQFDYANAAISIRTASLFPRSSLPSSSRRYGIYIEEPYDMGNTARSVLHLDAGANASGNANLVGRMPKIRAAIRDALAVFSTGEPSLERLGVAV